MRSHLLNVLALGAALVVGIDLAGFQIETQPTLIVEFGQTSAMNGAVVEKNGL